jgi:surfeit locus 1 family protein
MSVKRIPLIPTLLVLAAVAVMIRLGFWQLDRMHQKGAMLDRYKAAQTMSAEAPWPRDASSAQAVLFRRTAIECQTAGPDQPLAGHSAAGQTGWAHAFECVLADGRRAQVVIGWSRDLALRQWSGGTVSGWIAPGAEDSVRLIADPPLAGLEANARPDPANVPNNHWSYAIQWFLFALTALVIYGIALRRRLAA